MNAVLHGWLVRTKLDRLMQTPLRVRFARGIFWLTIAAIINQGTNLVTAVIVARLIGKVEFGELNIITTTVSTFGVFAGLGVGITATKYVAELRSTDPVRAAGIIGFLMRVVIVCGGIISAIIFWFAPSIADKILGAPQLITELRISCGLLFFNALSGVQTGTLLGLEAFRPIVLINLIGGIAGVGFIAIGAWQWGLSGAVSGYTLTAALTWLVAQFALTRELHSRNLVPHHQSSRQDWNVLWRFALPAVIVSLATQPFAWLVRVMLANQPNGYAELGLFSAAFAWGQLVLFLPDKIVSPTLPIMTNLLAEGRIQSFFRTIKMTSALSLGIALLTGLPLILASPLIMSAYGSSFESGWFVLVIILGAYCIGALTIALRSILISLGHMWLQVVYSIVFGVALTSITVWLMPTMGALGLAWAYLGAFVAAVAVQIGMTYVAVNKRASSSCGDKFPLMLE